MIRENFKSNQGKTRRLFLNFLAVVILILMAFWVWRILKPARGPVDYQGKLVPENLAEAFDMSAIRGATLSRLDWQESSAKIIAGVKIIDGTWSPGVYRAVTANGQSVKTINLSSRGRLYYPEGTTGQIPIMVLAAHLADHITNNENAYIKIVKGLKVAIFVQGESPADWNALGYKGKNDQRNALINDGMADVIKRNLCGLRDLQTSNFPLVLARTNMLALTLASRLLEQNGKSISDGALYGGSKEGYATWAVSAVDDRFKITAPQRFQTEDLDGIVALERNSGCGPNGASKFTDVKSKLARLDWQQNTEEGKATLPLINVASFVNQLKPEFIFLGGDVGMPGMHDGNFFTIDAESQFLENFQEKPFRYDRWAGLESGQNPPSQSGEEESRKLAILAQLLTSVNTQEVIDNWVKIKSAEAIDDGTEVRFKVEVKPDEDISHVWIYWAQSSNREFNDIGQSPWQRIELTRQGNSWTYVSGAITPTKGDEVAWYGEMEENINLGGGYVFPRKDASPIYLLRELPELSCEDYSRLRCKK